MAQETAQEGEALTAPPPLVAVTMGDPAGIGPEVVLRALADPAVRAACRPIVFGDGAALRETAVRLGLAAEWTTVSPDALDRGVEGVQVCDLGGVASGLLFAGRATREGGAASLRYIEAAAEAVRCGVAAALVTAPINKEAIGLAGSRFAGHTDLLAGLCGVERVVMMLAGGPLRVALVTHHIALADVPGALSAGAIAATARITHASLRRDFGIGAPRVAVCGLNPHASDGGRFGNEERLVVEPAVSALQGEGIDARGPLPPDTCFVRAARGEFDVCIALYHDQGLIPLKLLAFDDAVNVTLGLPIVRTSVDHGTAYDIAGRGVASARSMVAAILLAVRISEQRRAQ